MLGQHACDVWLPGRSADQAVVKSIRLTELKAEVFGCVAKLLRRRRGAERVQDAPLVLRQRVGVSGGKAPQQRRVAGLRLAHAPFALGG